MSLLFSIQGFANPINKIDFVGLNVISSTTLISILPVKIGDQYNQNTSDEIIQSLFNTGYFSDINVSSNNDNLTITVSENPYIKYFIVNNIKSNWLDTQQRLIDSSSLDEYIESNELSAGNMYTKLKLSDFISLLKSKYTSAGFYNVQIEPTVEIDDNNILDTFSLHPFEDKNLFFGGVNAVTLNEGCSDPRRGGTCEII